MTVTSFDDPLAGRLFPRLETGVHWGLERTLTALGRLGDPHLGYATLHVGGTNGKGSVTSSLASVLRTAGHRTGSYTSPHLCSIRERMLVDGAAIPDDRLLAYADDVRPHVEELGLSFFEAVTVLAMYAFAREDVRVGVMEVGLGGRLDSTNVIRPEVTAITNVAMDHAEYLGDTLEAIASEKAGILKSGVPFVTAETNPAILRLLRERAEAVGAPFSHVPPDDIRDVVVARRGTSLTLATGPWGALELSTPLVGHHQAANAALAVRMLEALGDGLRPTRAELLAGLSTVIHHGRDEVLEVDGTTWLLDVAHNVAGVGSLVDTIDRLRLPRPLVAVVGMLGDKDWRAMLPALLSRTDAAYLTHPPTAPADRRWDPVAAADAVESIAPVRVVPDFRDAVERARERAGAGTVVVTGSAHSVGPAMALLGVDPLGSPGRFRA